MSNAPVYITWIDESCNITHEILGKLTLPTGYQIKKIMRAPEYDTGEVGRMAVRVATELKPLVSIFREMMHHHRRHWGFVQWLKGWIRTGKRPSVPLGDTYLCQFMLVHPEMFTMLERDHAFLKIISRTEAFLAVNRRLLSPEVAREIMCTDPWGAFRFCPDRVPADRFEDWANRDKLTKDASQRWGKRVWQPIR